MTLMTDDKNFHGLQLSPAMHDYIQAVVDPFGATQPAVIPDSMNDLSLCLRDNYEASTSINNFTADVHGVLIWIAYGYSTLQYDYASINGLVWTVNVLGLDENNYPVLNASGKYISSSGLNYSVISGSVTSVDITTSLISRIRPISAGLRVLPVIEAVTDPSQNFMSYIIGGQLAPADMFTAIDNGAVNLETLVKNSKGAKIFANNRGCTVRADPFQAEFQMDMFMLEQAYSSTIRWDAVRVPVILAKFNQPIATTEAMPFIVNAQWWFECGLKQPTPIYSDDSPCDPCFEQIKSILSFPCEDHPYVVSGHSFKKFNPGSPAFLKTLAFALKMSSKIPGISFSGAEQLLLDTSRGLRYVAKRRKQSRRNRRRQKQTPGLSGTRRPPNVPKKVRNSKQYRKKNKG
jgi:hypothetical protein